MTSPKPLLDTGSGTFLDRVVGALRGGGVTSALVVVSDPDSPISARARQAGGIPVVTRYPAEDGPLGSIRSALAHLREEGSPPGAILLLPVDMPLVRRESVAAVMAAWQADPTLPMVRPEYQGKSGHPVLFAGAALELLTHAPSLPEGARSVVSRFRAEGRTVRVDDPGILVDIDTLPEYRRHFPGPSRRRFQSR